MSTHAREHIHGISAAWDGVELELTMTVDAISRFASVLSAADGDAFAIDSVLNVALSLTMSVVEVANGPVKISVADNTVTIKGDSSALKQIANNLLGLIVLAETKGVSHMHFDHVSDQDLISSDSASLIVSIEG
ncbi:MAG: hypothetical protein U1F19_08495 [Lysobacterales bacterium]